MGSDEGTFLQEYCMYFKKKWQNQGANYPQIAEGDLISVYLSIHNKYP